jgi:Probable Zinc-ribbon domain
MRNPGRRNNAGSKALGRLRDGTPYFAPLGEITYDPDEDRVQCHLCGEWFRTIGGAHLIRRHCWTLAQYRDAFALLKGDPTCARVEALGAGSGRSVWWLCRQCEHEWRAAVTDRARGRGCPRCTRRRVADASSRRNRRVSPDRSLALKRPDLSKELHPTRNADLDPLSLGAYSNQVVWWLCPACGDEWQRAPYARRAAGRCLVVLADDAHQELSRCFGPGTRRLWTGRRAATQIPALD